MSRGLPLLLVIALVGTSFLAMWPASYTRYSSLGIDSDRSHDTTIVHRYVRLRWPGDGTVRCGMGCLEYPADDRDCSVLDFAGDFFTKAEIRTHRAATLGFGYWNSGEYHDNRHGQPRWGRWISMPSWLPAVASGALFWLLQRWMGGRRFSAERHV